MRKINPFMICGMMILLVTLSSCSGLGSNKGSKQNVDASYRTGSQGLTMNFMQNMPPYRIYDNERLNVGLEIYNNGATDMKGSQGRVYLSGFDPTIITNIYSSGQPIPAVEGKQMYNTEGSYTNVYFDGYIRSLQARNIDEYKPTLLATLCYSYETIADPMVCLDPDPYTPTQREKGCNAEVVTNTKGSQGAPVAVSSVEVEPTKGKTRFKIYVSNVGGGQVFRDGYSYLDRCSPYDSTGLQYNDINIVRVSDVSIGTTSITGTCKPLENGYLRIKDSGAGYMVCEYSGITGSEYTTPLRIKLEYNYRSSVRKEVQIVKIP